MGNYEIILKENLEPRRLSDFSNMEIHQNSKEQTILTGELADQAALFGLLSRIRDLGLTLLSLRKLEENNPAGETGSQSNKLEL